MLDYLKKSLLTGIGLALRSKDEIEELAKEFAQKSSMSQDEARQFFTECQQKYEEARSNLDRKIESSIEKVITKLELPTKKDIQELNNRIDELNKKIAGLNS